MNNDLKEVISEIVRLQKEEDARLDVRSEVSASTEQDISRIITEISEAYHSEWKKEKLEFAQNFLAIAWSGIPLPVLSICGRGTQEIRYSKYLGYFLDPKKPHGLGSRFLDELLSLVTEEKVDTYQAEVETEKWIGEASKTEECRCDIVIDSNSHVVFIEQKIGSGESVSKKSKTTQLQRYDEAISQNDMYKKKKQIRIYLTPTERKPPNSKEEWHPVTHYDLIMAGTRILSKGGISGVARDNMKRFLLDLIIGPFAKEEDKIQTLVELAKESVLKDDFMARLRFNQMVSHNELLVKVLMEG